MTAGWRSPPLWVGLVVVALAAWLGHVVLAVGVATVLVARHQLARARPDLAATAEAAVLRGARWIGSALSAVLLTAVHALVILPAALICRLPGLDPLHTGRNRGWRARSARRDRPLRAFADDRRPPRTRTSEPGGGRRRIRLALVGLVVAVAVAGGALALTSEDATRALTDAGGPASFDPFQSAALADEPWATEAATEFGEAFSALSYAPFVGYYLPDHQGRHVNIADRERLGYRPPAGAGDPIDVWVFGGSTLFGYAAQRDGHTIPSELARLGEDDGLELRVRNFGCIGYVNYQETLLLAELLGTEPAPDLVVFYDGYNDKGVHLAAGLGEFGAVGEPTQTFAPQFRSIVHEALRTGGGRPVEPPVGVQDRATAVANLVDVYDRGIDLARRLGAAYGFDVRHYWHPDIYTKDLVPGEQDLLEPMGVDAFQYEVWSDLSADVRAALPRDVVDLSDALDDVAEPVFTSFVHTDEVGARVMAEAIYADLRPDLVGAGRAEP